MINKTEIILREDKILDSEAIVQLYKLNNWSSAEKPDLLIKALTNSDTLIQAYYNDKLMGLGNAISDGYLVVYYPHLLIHPDYQGLGIGSLIMCRFKEIYSRFHQQMLTADGKAIDFYNKCGFVRAGKTEPMWIYQGNEH